MYFDSPFLRSVHLTRADLIFGLVSCFFFSNLDKSFTCSTWGTWHSRYFMKVTWEVLMATESVPKLTEWDWKQQMFLCLDSSQWYWFLSLIICNFLYQLFQNYPFLSGRALSWLSCYRTSRVQSTTELNICMHVRVAATRISNSVINSMTAGCWPDLFN